MELVEPLAIAVQLSFLPDAERDDLRSRLRQLASNPDTFAGRIRKNKTDPKQWLVQLTDRDLALVYAEGGQLKVLSVVPRHQIDAVLKPKGKNAA